MRANLRYEKNQKREDVKSHHDSISFDPRDGTDNGLTVDRAQEDAAKEKPKKGIPDYSFKEGESL